MLTICLRFGVFIALIALQGCTSMTYASGEYRRVTFAAPEHYEVWLVDVLLEKSGERSWRQPGGTVKCCWKGPKGPAGPGAAADPFPELIWIHWFSFSEQKHYTHLIRVPPDLNERMREPARVITNFDVREVPRHTLTIGLAPGGKIVMWIQSQIGNEIEVMRMQAKPIEGDPSHFQERTKEYLKDHGDYLKEHGLQLDKW
ncbi:DUF2931 family protein [Marinobacter sp. GN3S48]|uniref:DUF2931 family protein n=1 Tax=Marinobacter sp. GN3S48 TaxID=3382302 RepID=UPI00387AD629